MHALTLFHLISLGVDDSNVWRAVAVAWLALAAFVLNRYRQSLGRQPRRVRLALVSLRAASFLLLLGALVGVRLDYLSANPGRVLVRYAPAKGLSAEGSADDSRALESAVERAIAALNALGFEAVTETDAGVPPTAQQHGHDEGFAAAIVLTEGALGAVEARREVERAGAAAGGAPVYVVTDLRPAGGPNVALESVALLGRPARGVPLTLRCMVHGRGMRGHESLVTITDAARVQSSARVYWNGDDEWQAVTLDVVPKVAGWSDYVARIEPAGGEDAGVLARSLTVYVEERRTRVLFFEGEPTWEAKFIRRALDQTGLFEVDYFAQVSRAATLGSTTEADRQKQLENGGAAAAAATETPESKANNAAAAMSPEARLHRALQSAASLSAYDSIIVGATPNAMLSAAEAARLISWVERRGGGLILLGGNGFAGSIAAPNGRLYALMPTDLDSRGLTPDTQQVARGAPLEAEKTGKQFALVPTEAGAAGPLRGYLSASQGALAAALTGQGLSLRGQRPGAVVLASAGQGNGGVGASNTGAPLIAAMRYGAGRVLVFAPTDSWRIRTSASGAQDDTSGPFGALWQGLTLWAAEGASPQVLIALDDETPAVGQEITAEIRVRDQSFAPSMLDRVKARLQPLTDETGEATSNAAAAAAPQEILFAPDKTEASVWRARFRAPSRGRFSLEADYSANHGDGSTEKRFAVVAPARREAGAARDTLRRAARATGGELLATDQLNDLLERLSEPSQSAERVRRTWELRTWWPLAFILPLLLSAEWLTRRWWQMD
ncbi:MAG TPA: hypothetical protein VGX92_16725 [Pyrinomonadaceae bacterium]|jgi:hypothetical protein|nr:hypothetical protein [Pyrinomonadaceae bacterium]